MQSFYNSTRSASNSSLVVASGMFSSGRVSFKEKYSVFFFSSTHYTLHQYADSLYISLGDDKEIYFDQSRASLVGDHFLYSCDHIV